MVEVPLLCSHSGGTIIDPVGWQPATLSEMAGSMYVMPSKEIDEFLDAYDIIINPLGFSKLGYVSVILSLNNTFKSARVPGCNFGCIWVKQKQFHQPGFPRNKQVFLPKSPDLVKIRRATQRNSPKCR